MWLPIRVDHKAPPFRAGLFTFPEDTEINFVFAEDAASALVPTITQRNKVRQIVRNMIWLEGLI
jgi:hypothetical protein